MLLRVDIHVGQKSIKNDYDRIPKSLIHSESWCQRTSHTSGKKDRTLTLSSQKKSLFKNKLLS